MTCRDFNPYKDAYRGKGTKVKPKTCKNKVETKVKSLDFFLYFIQT